MQASAALTEGSESDLTVGNVLRPRVSDNPPNRDLPLPQVRGEVHPFDAPPRRTRDFKDLSSGDDSRIVSGSPVTFAGRQGPTGPDLQTGEQSELGGPRLVETTSRAKRRYLASPKQSAPSPCPGRAAIIFGDPPSPCSRGLGIPFSLSSRITQSATSAPPASSDR